MTAISWADVPMETGGQAAYWCTQAGNWQRTAEGCRKRIDEQVKEIAALREALISIQRHVLCPARPDADKVLETIATEASEALKSAQGGEQSKKWPGRGNAFIGWLDEECGECRGSGVDEYIDGFPRDCAACHGTGLAQGMEARRAETAKTGSVHESAVRKDAP